MTLVTEPAALIRFEGYTPGTEIWGSTQANFLIQYPGQHAKEAAVLLNDPAARLLAVSAGREDSQEFREEAAKVVGEAVLKDIVDRGAPLESIIMASAAYFDARPNVLAEAEAALKA
jgi:hypothetical protein